MTETHCWRCGVAQHPERPRRDEHDSEQSYLIACLVWLDHEYPGRTLQRARVVEWERLEKETDLAYVKVRLHELLDRDDPGSAEEFDRLAEIYRNRTTTKKESTQ